MWASANVIVQGFERLRRPESSLLLGVNTDSLGNTDRTANGADLRGHLIDGVGTATNSLPDDDFDWMRFFPFVSKSTGGIAESLISGRELGTATRGFPSPNNELFHDTLLAQYQDLFDPFTDYTLGLSDIVFDTT
jgi:hypothetical protein